ncbi:MAG: DNA-processing protein DprA [Pseudomonadota bacterium]
MVPGIGSVTFRRLVESFGRPEQIFAAGRGELSKIKGIKAEIIDAVVNRVTEKRAEKHLKMLEKYGIKVLTYEDAGYPRNLRNIYDPPALLFVKGDLTDADNYSVGVVGSRNSTYYGQKTTEQLCRSLVNHGLTVVSGLARGIDTAAHVGALSGKGRTVAVLGSGLDIVYPPENRELYGKIAENGAVVSEFPLETPPEARNFPVRNRIISGLSLGIVVVEATQKSGSLITANFALEQGREIFAVPGSVNSLRSSGTHKLIKQGAKLVERAEDIVEELRTQQPLVRPGTDTAVREPEELSLPDEEKEVLNIIEDYPQHIDELARRGSLAVQRVSGLLLNLELKGLVQQLPGKLFIRK